MDLLSISFDIHYGESDFKNETKETQAANLGSTLDAQSTMIFGLETNVEKQATNFPGEFVPKSTSFRTQSLQHRHAVFDCILHSLL